MGKPNWACATCGMYSSRKSSVKRYIQNIHAGNANFVPFVDYLAGRKSGIYWPVLPPTYQKKNNETNKVDYLNIMSEALAPFSKLIGKGVQGIVDAIVLTHKIEDLDKDSSIKHI